MAAPATISMTRNIGMRRINSVRPVLTRSGWFPPCLAKGVQVGAHGTAIHGQGQAHDDEQSQGQHLGHRHHVLHQFAFTHAPAIQQRSERR